MLRVLLYGRQVLATRLNISVVNLRFFIIVWDELNHDYFWSKFCQTKLTSANFFLLRKSMKTSTLVISMDFCSPRRLVDSSGWYFSLNLCNIKQNVSVVIQIYSTFHAKHFWYQMHLFNVLSSVKLHDGYTGPTIHWIILQKFLSWDCKKFRPSIYLFQSSSFKIALTDKACQPIECLGPTWKQLILYALIGSKLISLIYLCIYLHNMTTVENKPSLC